LGFSCYIWNIEKTLKVARIIKRSTPSVKIILGGPEVSDEAGDIIRQEPCIDIIVRGEGEKTFAELAGILLFKKGIIDDVLGITFRNKGGIFSNPNRPPIEDLDQIPSPYLAGLFDLDRFPKVRFETMRGCPYHCHYCQDPKNLQGVRYFSQERLRKELKYIFSKKPFELYFIDSTFNADKKRAKDILKVCAIHNRSTILHLDLKAELLDREAVILLKQARVRMVEVGLQSLNPVALKQSNRVFNRHLFEKNLKLLINKHFSVQLDIIAGLPGDRYNDLKDSFNWGYSFKPAQVEIFQLMILPGTHFRQNARGLGIIYNRRPPYFLLRNRTFSRQDFIRAQRLGVANNILLSSGILRNSAHLLRKNLSLDYTDILEMWTVWNRVQAKPSASIRKTEYLKDMDLFKKDILDFVKYVCKQSGRPGYYQKIRPCLEKDWIRYCAGREIKKRLG